LPHRLIASSSRGIMLWSYGAGQMPKDDDWRLEVEAAKKGWHPAERGIDPELDVVLHHMERGDLMPLAQALADLDDQLASTVGYELKCLLANGYLRVKVARPGAPQRPDLFARKLRMAMAYRQQRKKGVGSDEAFRAVEAEFHISVDTVRRAVAEVRRRARNPQPPKPAMSLAEVMDIVARK
jgi:hypothetical protein